MSLFFYLVGKMEVAIFTIMIVVSLLFLAVGFFKEQFLLFIFGGIILLLSGMFVLFGISYVSGVTVTNINSTTNTVDNTYTVWHTTFTTPLAILLGVLGIGFILMGALQIYAKPEKVLYEDNDSED